MGWLALNDGIASLDFFVPVLIHGFSDKLRSSSVILFCKALKINIYWLRYIDRYGFHMYIVYVCFIRATEIWLFSGFLKASKENRAHPAKALNKKPIRAGDDGLHN